MSKKNDPKTPDPGENTQGKDAEVEQLAKAPSVGRIVHVWCFKDGKIPAEGPFPAIVNGVDPDDPNIVSVTCFPPITRDRGIFGPHDALLLPSVRPIGVKPLEHEIGEDGSGYALRWGWPTAT